MAAPYGVVDKTIRDGSVVRWHSEVAYSDHERAERFVVRYPDYDTGRCMLVSLNGDAVLPGFPPPKCMSTLRHVTPADDWDGPTDDLNRGPFRICRGNPGHTPAYMQTDLKNDYWDAVTQAHKLAKITRQTQYVFDNTGACIAQWFA